MIVSVIFSVALAKFDLRSCPAYSPKMALKKRTESVLARTPLAKRILEQREGADAEVSLERLEAALIDASRYDIVASLKALEKSGQGQFIAGRKGQKSRFVWGARPVATKAEPLEAKAARGRAGAKPEPKASKPEPKASKPEPKASKPEPKASKPEPKAGKGRAAAKPEPREVEDVLAKGLARKSLVPLARGLERTKLSRGGAEPVSRVSRSLQHSFHLRPGAMVTVDLPEDVTLAEVERFCNFLKALPFAGPRR
jgi:hypothetical protein